MRPIDADVLKEYKCSQCDNRERCEDREQVCSEIAEIDEQPTIEAEQKIHAHWEINPDGYYPYCSNCKTEPKGREMTDYCPNCGARMDGDET